MTRTYPLIGKILQVNLKITVTIGIVAVSLAVLAILAYVQKWIDRETLKFIVSTVGTSGGITSAFYVAESLKATKGDKKQDRSFSLISTWTSPSITIPRESFSKIRIATQQEQSISNHPAIIKRLIEDPSNSKLLQDVTTILNFLEELATCVKYDLADEEILKEYFKLIITRIYEKFELWIKEERQQRGDDLFLELEKLYQRWKT